MAFSTLLRLRNCSIHQSRGRTSIGLPESAATLLSRRLCSQGAGAFGDAKQSNNGPRNRAGASVQ
jgi:hypothetical protein